MFSAGDAFNEKRMDLVHACSSFPVDSLPLLATVALDLSTNSLRSRVRFSFPLFWWLCYSPGWIVIRCVGLYDVSCGVRFFTLRRGDGLEPSSSSAGSFSGYKAGWSRSPVQDGIKIYASLSASSDVLRSPAAMRIGRNLQGLGCSFFSFEGVFVRF